MLSGAFFAAYGIGSLVVGGALFPPLALLRLAGWRAGAAGFAMRRLVLWSWRLFVWCGRVTGLFRVEVSDEDRALLAVARGAVVAANHLTLIDVIVLSALLPDATAVVKAAAGRNFFYSLVVKGAFIINDDPARVLEEAAAHLARGTNLVVFPQGTRVPPGERRPLRRGAAQIALHAGAPVVPVEISCEPLALSKGQPWYDVADRTIVWRLRVRGSIAVAKSPRTCNRAAAAELTERISAALDASAGGPGR